MIADSPAGVYVHVPFCVQKCSYCDFLSFPLADAEEASCAVLRAQQDYVNAAVNELKAFVKRKQMAVDTVYIGGGTPTALPASFLCEILEVIKYFYLIADAEITVEVNPGTVDKLYLQTLRAAGVNRLSIGLQSAHDGLLQKIGRIHSFEDFEETFFAAREVGFDNVNVDLMFALPGQTMEQWHETLEVVILLSPEHISAYSLTPAEDTPLWEQMEKGETVLPSEDADRDMYHKACKKLTEAGYKHYEISNFSKPGRESRHNINCWTMKPYYGFGLGAHSFGCLENQPGKARWSNTTDMTEYLMQWRDNNKAESKKEITLLTQADLIAEAMLLGLRLTEGVNEKGFAQSFGKTPTTVYSNEINKLINSGLLKRKGGNITLTPQGLDLANQVFAAFLV